MCSNNASCSSTSEDIVISFITEFPANFAESDSHGLLKAPYTTPVESTHYTYNYLPPFAFFEIREILNLRPKQFPLNVKIRTFGHVGKVKGQVFSLVNKDGELWVVNNEPDNNPKPNTTIEVFGTVTMKCVNNKIQSIFLCDFWSKLGNLTNYGENLREKQKPFLFVQYVDITDRLAD